MQIVNTIVLILLYLRSTESSDNHSDKWQDFFDTILIIELNVFGVMLKLFIPVHLSIVCNE